MSIILTKDPDILAQLNKEIQELHVAMYPEKYKPYNFKAFKSYYISLLQNEKVHCFLCIGNNGPTGYCVIEEKIYPDSPFSWGANVIYIHQIYVKAEKRNTGIGKKMIEHIKQTAHRKNIQRIELDVKYLNQHAMSFFANMGFAPFNTMMEMVL